VFHIANLNEYLHEVDQQRCLGAYGFAALGAEAKPAVPALIALLDDKDQRVRYLAVFALRCLGPVAAEALPSLLACLNDPDFTIRDEAVTGLGTIQQQPEQVVPVIIAFLEKYHSNAILCYNAIGALGMFGPKAKSAVPTILGYLNDQEQCTRSEATNALLKIDPQAAIKAGVK
jgi:HEAT repeat protein